MSNGQPTWSLAESSAVPIVTDLDPANPTIGNVSVFYSQPLGLWLMMYDGGRGSFSTEGMYFTYAAKPWGPWSTPQLVFNACRDKGFGNFMFYYYATAKPEQLPQRHACRRHLRSQLRRPGRSHHRRSDGERSQHDHRRHLRPLPSSSASPSFPAIR